MYFSLNNDDKDSHLALLCGDFRRGSVGDDVYECTPSRCSVLCSNCIPSGVEPDYNVYSCQQNKAIVKPDHH